MLGTLVYGLQPSGLDVSVVAVALLDVGTN